MALTSLLLLVALPVVEIWTAFVVAGQIGALSTLLLLVALSCAGVWALKSQGIAAWSSVSTELAKGRSPAPKMLDGVIGMFGALLLVVPGFVTAAMGILLLLPPVRALLRPLILASMTRRAAGFANRSRISGFFMSSRVDRDGVVHNNAASFGDVIDSEGWDVDPAGSGPYPLIPGSATHSRDAVGGVIDTDGRPSTGR